MPPVAPMPSIWAPRAAATAPLPGHDAIPSGPGVASIPWHGRLRLPGLAERWRQRAVVAVRCRTACVSGNGQAESGRGDRQDLCVQAGWPRGRRRDPHVAAGLGPGEIRGPTKDADPAAWGQRQVADGEAVGDVVRQHDGVDGTVLVGEADLLAGGGGGRRRGPGTGGVDGVAVAVQPAAEVAERSLLQLRDAAGAVGADVDQQVAAVGDDVGQQVDQLGAGEGVGGGLLGVVAEGLAQAASQLPGPCGRRVGMAYSWVWTS
jgi:hypothetical protein